MISPTKTPSARLSNVALGSSSVRSRDRLPRATGSRARRKWSAFCANSPRVCRPMLIRSTDIVSVGEAGVSPAAGRTRGRLACRIEMIENLARLRPFEHHAIVFFPLRARAELLAKGVQKIAKPTRIGGRRTRQAEPPHLRRNQSH